MPNHRRQHAERWALWRILGSAVEAIHLLDGVPVPGPATEVIPDLLLVAKDLDGIDRHVAALRAIGYEETDSAHVFSGCRAFRKEGHDGSCRLLAVAHDNRPILRRLLALHNARGNLPNAVHTVHDALAWERAFTNAATFTVAHPTPDEAKALTALWERSVRATHGFLTEANVATYRPIVLGALQTKEMRCLLLQNGGRPLGFLLTSGGTHIEALFLEPSFMGLGLGARLLTRALADGATSIDVNEDNPRALRFYEAFGFHQIDRSPQDPSGAPSPILSLALPTAQNMR